MQAAGVQVALPSLKLISPIVIASVRAVHHSVPFVDGDKVSYAVDSDEPAGPLLGKLSVSGAESFQVGWQRESLALAAKKGTPATWPPPGRTPGDGLRALALPGVGIALAFRLGDGVWLGWADSAGKPQGALARIALRALKVGEPGLAWNGRELRIVFAAQTDARSPLRLHTAHAQFGAPPSEATPLAVAPGGPGGPAFAPVAVGIEGGRFLVAWSEGEPVQRLVRVQTYDADFQPLGSAFDASGRGAYYGQVALAVGARAGALAFIANHGGGDELWAAALSCP